MREWFGGGVDEVEPEASEETPEEETHPEGPDDVPAGFRRGRWKQHPALICVACGDAVLDEARAQFHRCTSRR